jgi:alkylation response protein AidB-like acyl-CoA dehydrogenase
MAEEASQRGWRPVGLPVREGGGGSTVAVCALVEELAFGDMEFAVVLDETIKVQQILARTAGARCTAGSSSASSPTLAASWPSASRSLSAMEILGGLAVMHREAQVEKCLRDCLSFLQSDGAQDSHRLRITGIQRGLKP